MIKIVYFDIQSATDYLHIYNGGNIIQSSEKVKDKSSQLANDTSAGVFGKLSWLSFFKGEASTQIDANLSYETNSLIRTTLSNTVLTDFLSTVQKDNVRIPKFKDYQVTIHKNSMAYFITFTPYLTMSKTDFESDGFIFDASKMDSAFRGGKGYYEMVATSSSTNERIVFRFNIEAFRNNYGIADLTKMNLVYYGVKVGNINLNMLDMENEFSGEFGNKELISAHDIENNTHDDALLDVYDIILAGVEL